MNKDRRRRLALILEALLKMKAAIISGEQDVEKVRELADEAELIADEEQEALDSLPENLQFSERADNMNDNVTDIYDISANITDIADALEDPDDEVTEDEFDDAYSEIEGLIDDVSSR